MAILGLAISKGYSSYCNSFYLISTKLYEDIAYRGEIQAITFLVNWPSLKKMWLFEILTWESILNPQIRILKYAINGKRLADGTGGPSNCICRVMSNY